MDLIKIGKYIADKRKSLGMTQRQLAERLGMSDKSVSKWERGVCLPDVSVYSELCGILGISINAFLAGEDIPQECVAQKAEENILGVVTDSKQKQSRLKKIICLLSLISIIALSVIAAAVYLENRPQNTIEALPGDSTEMETARLFSGPDGAHIYKFTTTDEYSSFKLYSSEYRSGELISKENLEIGFEGIGSPEGGTILIFPDFKSFEVKLVISVGDSKFSTEVPILEDVPDRAYYGRSSTGLRESTAIRYDEEQPLVALIYDNDEMRVIDIHDLVDGLTDALAYNDYVYYFSFEFSKS